MAQCLRHHGGCSACWEMASTQASPTQNQQISAPNIPPRHSFMGLLESGTHGRVIVTQGLVLAHWQHPPNQAENLTNKLVRDKLL